MTTHFRLTFRIHPDRATSREVKDLIEILQGRGAKPRRLTLNSYYLYIPIEMDPAPFQEAVKDCPAVAWTDVILQPVVLTADAQFSV